MAKVEVKNLDGKKVGDVELDDAIFAGARLDGANAFNASQRANLPRIPNARNSKASKVPRA